MAQIEGFRGIRYSLMQGTDISPYLAPPYDTIMTDQAKNRLLEHSPHNIVAIDLPYLPPKQAGPEHLYRQAGERLREWLEQDVLTREIEPAIYLYRQSFTYGGKNYIRRGFIGRLRLEELGKGSVLPHEQTYSGPKEDRLLLTRHSQAYISQVFCLYEDSDNEIADVLFTKAQSNPTYWGVLDGVKNEVWVITERSARHWLASKMAPKPVFIADGHHRYSTALNYRNLLAQQAQLHQNHPANYVSAMFVSMSEPGLLVLPTHRVVMNLKPFTLAELAEALKDQFHPRWVSKQDDPQHLEQAVVTTGDQSFAFVKPDEDRALVVWPQDGEHLLDHMRDKYTLAWRTLPVAILHNFIFEKVVYPKWLDGDQPQIEYFHRADETVEFVNGHPNALGAIVPPTPVESVRKVCSDKMLMPQKSTYFYPKLATGLIVYPMFD